MVKSAVLKSEKNIEIEEFPKPKNIENGMLIKILSSGVCGTDPHIFNGERAGVNHPIIMGHEICGVIEEIGKKYESVSYDNFSVGDRVTIVPGTTCKKCYYCKTFPHMENYCIDRKIYGVTLKSDQPPHLFGGFSEYLYLLPGFWAYKIPENVTDDVGSLVEPLAVALRSVERGLMPGLPYISMGLGIGSNVVVQGSGTIGIFTTLIAKLMGANVITLDKIDSRLKVAKEFGASQILNVKNLTREERVQKVKELTNGIGADLAIECSGDLEAFEEGIEMLRRGGRYVEMGNFADIGFSKIKPSLVCRSDIEIVGSVISPPQNFRKAIFILKNYNFPFEKLITHRFRIEDSEKAIKNAAEQKGIKTVVKP